MSYIMQEFVKVAFCPTPYHLFLKEKKSQHF